MEIESGYGACLLVYRKNPGHEVGHTRLVHQMERGRAKVIFQVGNRHGLSMLYHIHLGHLRKTENRNGHGLSPVDHRLLCYDLESVTSVVPWTVRFECSFVALIFRDLGSR